MNTHQPSAVEQAAQLVWLRQFLAWIIPFNFSFALFEGVAFALFGDSATGLTALVMLTCSGVLYLARTQLKRTNIRGAVAVVCGGLLGADLIIVVLQPWLAVTLAFIPLLAVALALPYIDGRGLQLLIRVALFVTVVVALCGELVPNWTILPGWFVQVFRVASLTATVMLVMLLLSQFRRRLTRTLAQTKAAEERYAMAAHGANDGLWDWNLLANEIYLSPRWKSMLGYAEEAVETSPDEWLERIHPEDKSRVMAELAVHQDGLTPHFESEHRLMDANGRYRWVLSRGLAVRDSEGKSIRMAGSLTDVSSRKQIEAQLRHDVYHDALTGLPNRTLFMERLSRAIARTKRHPNYRFAVLFLDLDRFKVVNDSLGHTVGDRLLVGFARRLEGCLRPMDTVARLGGDEFTVLLDGISNAMDATRVADRVQETLVVPFNLNGAEVFTSSSIGIALSASNYEHPEELLRDADLALYRAKDMGKACYALFDPEMHTRAVALLRLETDLRRAIERNELVVHYQAIVSLHTGRISGFEALVRWQHPERGLVSPGEFIPVAEETGLIVPIGWVVMREACRQMQTWHSRFPAESPLTISVNFSGSQFSGSQVIEQCSAILAETGLDARSLRLEITESVMMESAEAVVGMLSQLRDLDIQLQIDDFGTGYSSLHMLHRLPINALKIDRSFVQRLSSESDNAEIVQAIITLAHSLDMAVVAEGVETRTQLDRLRALGCDYVQGFFCSRPISGVAADDLIASNPAWVSDDRVVPVHTMS